MKKHFIKRKEILSRLSYIQGNRKYYLFAWLFFSCFIVVFPILIRVFDYFIQQKALSSLWLDQNMSFQIFTFFVVYSALFLLQPRLLESILPFFIAKRGINSELSQDLAQSYYIKDTAQLLKIENIVATRLVPTHQQLYLRLEQQQMEAWFTVYTGLLWATPHLHLDLKLTEHCIGQKVEICYLPQSRIIIQLFAQKNLKQDLAYSKILQRLIQPLSSEKINRIPSKQQYALLSCQKIQAKPEPISQDIFHLNLKTVLQGNITIRSNEPHFDLFYPVLQQRYRLPSLTQIQQRLSLTSKAVVLYDLPAQLRYICLVLFALSGLFFLLAFFNIFYAICMVLAIFLLIAALLTPLIKSPYHLKILKDEES